MRGITVLKDGMKWQFGGNSNRHSSRGKYGRLYLARDLRAVLTALTVRHQQQEPTNSWFVNHAHWRIHPIQRTCKADGKINFNEIYH